MNDLTKRLVTPALVLSLAAAAQGCGSSNPAPDPARVPTVTKISVPSAFAAEEAVAVPAAVSRDGSTVVGTVNVRVSGMFHPVAAFRWTAAGGTVLLQTPDYGSTMATAVSADGSVVVGNAAEPSAEAPEGPLGWVWTQATGLQFIPMPDGVDATLALDVTSDGSLVVGTYVDPVSTARDIFVWSRSGGFVGLDEGTTSYQPLPAGISADGLRIAYNCVDITEDGCGGQGTRILENGSTDWAPGSASLVPAPLAQVALAYFTSDVATGEFGFYQARSDDLSVLGGYAIQEWNETPLALPSLWLGTVGQVNVLAGPGWNGFASAVSPDGSVAGFSRHFGVGYDWAHVWTLTSGERELYRLLEAADDTYGSSLLGPFGSAFGISGPITGFSADNRRAVGAVICFDCPPQELFGYVIDEFDLVIP